jgi:hypothetical protein
MTTPYAHKLVDYVFGRPRSNSPENEIADVFTTLASLGIQMHMNIFNLGLRGLKRMEKDETIDRIRAKRKTRHGRGPLPGFDPTPVAGVAQHVQTVGRGLRQEVKEPATIGEVMRNRDFSTGEPGKVVTITSLAHRSIIGDNDGPWPLTGVRGEFATDDIPALAAEVTMERPHGFRWGVGQRVRKVRGSAWRGRVVGFYRGSLTPEGYAVESEMEPGNVQVYPVAALEERA